MWTAPVSRSYENEKYLKTDSIICEFQIFCLPLHAE